MTTENPFDALKVIVKRMEEVLAQTSPGLRIVDTKFDPARDDGAYPHPDLMHVTFLLDPEVAFAAASPVEGHLNPHIDPPVDPDEQAKFDEMLAGMEAGEKKETKDEKAEARKQELLRMRDELKDPEGGIGLD